MHKNVLPYRTDIENANFGNPDYWPNEKKRWIFLWDELNSFRIVHAAHPNSDPTWGDALDAIAAAIHYGDRMEEDVRARREEPRP